MTSKYIVSCFSPPNALVIESGQEVKVEGWKRGNKILAKNIMNITKNGPTCNCGDVPKALLGEKVTLKGKVSNVKYSSEGVQFDVDVLAIYSGVDVW